MERRMWIVTRPNSHLMMSYTIRGLACESKAAFLSEWKTYYPSWKNAYRHGYRCVRCTVKTED